MHALQRENLSTNVGFLQYFLRTRSGLFVFCAAELFNLHSLTTCLFVCLFTENVESDPQGSVGFSLHQLSPVMQLPQTSSSPSELNHEGSFKKTSSTSTPALCKSLCDQPELCSPCPVPTSQPNSDKPLSSRRSSKTAEHSNPDTSTDVSFSQFPFPDEERATLEFPSIPLSSQLNPLRTSPRSVGAKLTPSPTQSRLELHSWPVLPPISPVRGERWALYGVFTPSSPLSSFCWAEHGWTSNQRQQKIIKINQRRRPYWGVPAPINTFLNRCCQILPTSCQHLKNRKEGTWWKAGTVWFLVQRRGAPTIGAGVPTWCAASLSLGSPMLALFSGLWEVDV